MGRRFVDARWVRQRMDSRDARIARETQAMRTQAATPPTICGWCPDLGARTAAAMAANGGRPVSHSICAACAARMAAE